MRVEDVYRAAANHLRMYGWRQGTAGATTKRCCLVEAIDVAAGPRLDLFLEAVTRFESAITGGRPAPSWNDRPERTLDEVLAALDRLAAWDGVRS